MSVTSLLRRMAATVGSMTIASTMCACGLIYTNVTAPRAYRSATPGDVRTNTGDEAASGTACARSVLFLFAWGDAGYAAAVHDALRDRETAVLYDVRTDLHVKAYALGTYTESCTIVTGKVGHL